jgi:glycosyltransferase involved in cell wall biosynthesis
MQDAITLAGWIDGEAKAKLLAESDIYVLPSHNEGLPMSVLEAMAMHQPVVTTRVGGIPELVSDGVDGLLIDASDQDALANALSTLLGDAALRGRLGQAARDRIEARYSDRVILPMLHTIYGATAKAN